jgi:hypothetical protein
MGNQAMAGLSLARRPGLAGHTHQTRPQIPVLDCLLLSHSLTEQAQKHGFFLARNSNGLWPGLGLTAQNILIEIPLYRTLN